MGREAAMEDISLNFGDGVVLMGTRCRPGGEIALG